MSHFVSFILYYQDIIVAETTLRDSTVIFFLKANTIDPN